MAAGDAGGDLGHLDRVGEPRAQMVVFRRDEHLALAGQPPPRARVLDPVEVALEAQPERVGNLGPGPVPCSDRAGGAGRQEDVDRRLALLAGHDAPAHERDRALVRAGPRALEIQCAVAFAVRESPHNEITWVGRRYAVLPGPEAPRAAWAAARRAMGTR